MENIPKLDQKSTNFHIVALPYPGRGHINPMINLLNSLKSQAINLLVTVIVTEEWLNIIENSRQHQSNGNKRTLHFRTIPNVLPSEVVRGSDFAGFYEAVMTKMGPPVEQVLDRLQPPASIVVADTELVWAVPAANYRNIPVASLWTMSASVLSMFWYFELVQVWCLQKQTEYTDCIPGVSPIRVSELPFQEHDERVTEFALQCISRLENAQFLLINTIYELEVQAIDTLRQKFLLPVYAIGPAIPHLETKAQVNMAASQTEDNVHLQWLDSQPENYVLYISLGSYLSVSKDQMEKFAMGVRQSGIRFFWVVRGDSFESVREASGADSTGLGLVVPWCDQLRVLCHASIGGFWTHCGWNSTLEGVYAGVPMLTFPIHFDQSSNGKQIVEDWKVGCRLRKLEASGKSEMTSGEISEAVKKFMDPKDCKGKEMRRRAREAGINCRKVTEKGGSVEGNLYVLIKDVTRNCRGN